jgi:hypothetical protein
MLCDAIPMGLAPANPVFKLKRMKFHSFFVLCFGCVLTLLPVLALCQDGQHSFDVYIEVRTMDSDVVIFQGVAKDKDLGGIAAAIGNDYYLIQTGAKEDNTTQYKQPINRPTYAIPSLKKR